MANEMMMKGRTYDPSRDMITGDWFISEKLDGRYVLWDGGGTIGLPASQVPWANTARDNGEVISTGLWSSSGKVVHCPVGFTEALPPFMLDGELWMGRGTFQECMSVTRKHVPIDAEWGSVDSKDGVRFMIFGIPDWRTFFTIRKIDYRRDIVYMTQAKLDAFPKERHPLTINEKAFSECWNLIKVQRFPKHIEVVIQLRLSTICSDAETAIKRFTDEIIDAGGEGAMLRAPWNRWTPGRSNTLLKYKPFRDAEGIVIGAISGAETDKGSKLLGMMGALILECEGGHILKLSGFTDDERKLSPEGEAWARRHPKTEMPVHLIPDWCKIGTEITYKYRELSDDGVPKEARYWRRRS